MRGALLRLGRLVPALLLGSLLGLSSRLLLFGLAVLGLGGLAEALPRALDPMGWADPVYTRAMLQSLVDVHVQGLAIQGSPGQELHAAWPAVFVDPARAHAALVRVVLQPGSAIIGRLIAAAVAHAGALGLGVLLVSKGWRSRRLTWCVTGLAVQAQVALGILGAQPAIRELEATGLSFAANALLPWLWQRSVAVGDAVSTAPHQFIAAALVALALLNGYVPSALLLALRGRARRATLGSACAVVLATGACAGALQAAAVPDAAPAEQVSATIAEPAALEDTLIDAATSLPRTPALIQSDRWFAEPSTGPSVVQVIGGGYQYQYVVNGRPEVIKGMGLNTQYASQLSPEARAARLDADMAAYRELGVNTVLGWDPAEFDETLLDAAQRHGIGVIVPFDLDPEADYTDPALRERLRGEVIAWVQRYRDHPALRMWGLGNEVLHKIVHPAWVGPQEPGREQNAEAFSDWLVETADAIHALDPNHPITYRSAEDAFVPWVAAALQRRGGGPRPWFVWGTNCYQEYLQQIVDGWTGAGMDVALWVSEFAPGTMAVPDRPDGFATMWGYVRRHPDWVLGGAVYAWTRNGPERVDRNFGLTDDGVPVDGRSLDMLSQLFHADP